MPSYHVTYRESKKVINVSDKSEIVCHIKDVFGIQALVKDIQLQLYDVEWEDFVDIDWDALPERGKLNVYVRRNERRETCVCLGHSSFLPYLSPIVIGSSPSVIHSKEIGPVLSLRSRLCHSGNESHQTTSHQPSPGKLSSLPLEKAEITFTSPSATPDENQEHNSKIPLLPWPTSFKIPSHKFRKALKEALDSGRLLNKTLKQYLLDTLYDEITKYTFYPTPAQYQNVAESLLECYPYLGFGLEHMEALTFWKTILSNKMRNGRKRVAKDEPIVVQRKRRFAYSQGNLSASSHTDSTWELMDFILPHSPGDGESDIIPKTENTSHESSSCSK